MNICMSSVKMRGHRLFGVKYERGGRGVEANHADKCVRLGFWWWSAQSGVFAAMVRNLGVRVLAKPTF